MIRGGDPSGASSPLGGAGRLIADLEAWAAAATADEGVRQRRRERWLRTQAEDEATILGVLADLAERDQAVVVATRTNRRHRGAVQLVGRDFALMVTEQRSTILVQVTAIVQVRTTPGGTGVVGDRALRLEVGWADALRVLAADRPRVLAIPSGGAPCGGELRSVGADVLTMRLEGDGSRAYLPIDAVDEIVIGDATVPTAFT